MVHGADNHTHRLLIDGQQPKFINSIILLKTEGLVNSKQGLIVYLAGTFLLSVVST